MCGFVGLFDPAGFDNERATRTLVTEMRDRLAHRGPDGAGLWMDASAGVALGCRRLSIQDLSVAGDQPMVSWDGRYVLALNGEIYNFADIRRDIDAVRGSAGWRGHSDTEVMVEAIALWGLEAALGRANGMFALAVWDRHRRQLWLARDRLGEKPLYYGWAGDALVFGSELKALWRHPRFDFAIDPAAMAGFLRLGYVLGPESIFAGVSKLLPGHLMRLDPAVATRRELVPLPYWSMRDAAIEGLEAQQSGRRVEPEELEALVEDAVARRMVADVPVGAFLSGGIDSSLVAALMAAGGSGPVRTYSVGFGEADWNEGHHARAVAAHLGTEHEEIHLGGREALALVGDLARIYDEPLGDDSMIPTALLCREARRGVAVALSGDGGDEFFAGYDRYPDAARWLSRRRATPETLRLLAGDFAGRAAGPLARWMEFGRIERRLGLFGELMAEDRAEWFNAALMSRTFDPGGLMADREVRPNPLLAGSHCLGRSNDIDRMMFMDSVSFLVDDILAKVDRASMAASLEVRCPLLDHRLVELSWHIPADDKTRNGLGKLPLRRMLHRHVPKEMVDRPKMGFNAPVRGWLRGPLRDWAESLMTHAALARHGLLDARACRTLWERFMAHDRGWNQVIWNVLMFQAWHESMTEAARGAPLRVCPDPVVA